MHNAANWKQTMWRPVVDSPDWQSDSTLSYVPGWGPYLFMSGLLLVVAAPIILFFGAPLIANNYGSIVWSVFILACLGGTIGGMNMLVQHRRTQQRHLRVSRTRASTADLVVGLGLLGVLATSSIITFFFRVLR